MLKNRFSGLLKENILCKLNNDHLIFIFVDSKYDLVNHTNLMDPQHFPKHVERGLQNPDLKSADRTLNNSADYAHGALQTEHLSVEVSKTCFCGFYTEVV